VNASDTTTGKHAQLLKELSSSIAAFQKDMELMQLDDRVMGMTFSEFGRRIASNASLGTDHGAAAPMILFGKNVKKGILGKNPEIAAEVSAITNIPFQYDFRSVYATVLEKWFCVKQPAIDSLLLKNYQSLPLIKGGPCGLEEDIDNNNDLSDGLTLKMSPNPYSGSGSIQFSTMGGYTMIQQIDAMGRVVKVHTRQSYDAGVYTLNVNDDALGSGTYFLRLQNGSLQKVIRIIKAR
jgi:hypothetical protein